MGPIGSLKSYITLPIGCGKGRNTDIMTGICHRPEIVSTPLTDVGNRQLLPDYSGDMITEWITRIVRTKAKKESGLNLVLIQQA